MSVWFELPNAFEPPNVCLYGLNHLMYVSVIWTT